jgi:DsbC/DsbD-like thiol-disulfide interchange protein
MKTASTFAFVATMALGLFAQDILSKRPAHVTVDPVAPVTIQGAKPAVAQVRFRVRDGFHVNSNKPNSDLLIPTEIVLTAIPEVRAGKPEYPAGHDFALTFSPNEKLSVYSGDVTVPIPVTANKPMRPGSYVLKGELKYQACDDRSCFPPKSILLEIPVKVAAK